MVISNQPFPIYIYKDLVHHPIETTMYKRMGSHQVPGSNGGMRASGHEAGAATGGRTLAASAKRPGERQRSWAWAKKCTNLGWYPGP